MDTKRKKAAAPRTGAHGATKCRLCRRFARPNAATLAAMREADEEIARLERGEPPRLKSQTLGQFLEEVASL